MGVLTAYSGDWEHGCAMVERASQLNPRHPGWYWFPLFYNAYRKGDYSAALSTALKINLPHFFYNHVVLAAASGQLGNHEAAREALRALLALRPDFAEIGRDDLAKWYPPELVEHLIDGLKKAGLQIESSSPSSAGPRADEGFWVAVLPFKYSGANADVTSLAEGLSEDIVTGLSQFSYLRVIARGSVSRYANATGDVRAIGKEIGARYMMEGSVRQAGSQLRIAVQLVDATTGAHLWAETFNRPFQPDAIFEVQDALVPRIVATVADGNGVLPRTMGDALRGRSSGDLTPYEAVLRGWSFYTRISPDEHAEVRAILERAVERADDYADAWALLSMLYLDEHRQGFNPRPDPLDRAIAAASRAVDLGPTSHFTHYALASVLFFRRNLVAFRRSADRAIDLNPMDANSVAFLGCLTAYAGDWQNGMAMVDRGIALNPHHPGWFWLPHAYNAYRLRDYAAALDSAVKVNMPAYFFAHAVVVEAQGQLGGREAAREALQHLLLVKPDIARTVQDDYRKWFVEPEFVEHVLDGLRKAGLDVAVSSTP